MRKTKTGVAAVAMLIVFVVCMTAGQILAVQNGNFRLQNQPLGLAFAAYMVVGALILARRRENSVGWVFSAVGLLAATGTLAMEYAEYSLITSPKNLAWGVLAAWYAAWFWFPLLGLTTVFTILLFPTGRPLSRRWAGVVWIAGLAGLAITVLASVAPTITLHDADFRVPNPVGIAGMGDVEQSAAGSFLFGTFLLCLLLALVQVFLRFRRSVGVERQQLKLFTFAAATVAVQIIVSSLFPALDLGDMGFGLVVSLPPIAAGVAILRYRLYEIDRIINRTIVYLLVTGFLIAVYAATVFVVGTFAIGSSDNLTVAVATLAAAAVFRPVLRMFQDFVDRRFYRRRYDAQQAADDFGSRLRQETDLEYLTQDLIGVVRETVQPQHASLWLVPEEARSERA